MKLTKLKKKTIFKKGQYLNFIIKRKESIINYQTLPVL